MADNNKATSFNNVKRYVVGVLRGWFTNKTILDELSEGQSEELLYKGRSIGSGGGTGVTVDNALSSTSENPVQNKVIYEALQNISGGGSGEYTLPIASESVLGGVKIGAGLEIDANGVLRVIGFQKFPGRITLSSNSVSLNQATQSVSVNVVDTTGDVSVFSSDEGVVNASINDGVITISSVGNAGGDATVTVSCAESTNYLSATETISVSVQGAVKIVSWTDGTDQEIKDMLDAHYDGVIDIHDHWNIGDERSVRLLSIPDTYGLEAQPEQYVTFVLQDAEEMKDVDGNNCAFIIRQKEPLSVQGVMSKPPYDSNNFNWSTMLRRTWLNSGYYVACPSIKSIVRQVEVVSSGKLSGGSTMARTNDRIFIPSGYVVTKPVVYTPNSGGITYNGVLVQCWVRYMSSSGNLYYVNNTSTGNIASGGNNPNQEKYILPCACI